MRASIVLALVPLGCLGATDFSGTWNLDRQQSKLISAAGDTLVISQDGPTFHCTDTSFTWSFRDDGSEVSYQIPNVNVNFPATWTTTAKWDGPVLVISAWGSGLMLGGRTEDRWELSADGEVLTITRTVRTDFITQAKLVYRKAKDEVVLRPGTKILLSLINTLNTKRSAAGDRVYLETAFPVTQNGHMIIPKGSYVAGTVTEVKRPGKMKGRGELYLRFDSLTLANGVTRDFHSRLDSADGKDVDRDEGKIRGEDNKSGDARTVAEGAGAGASVGSIAGSVAGHAAMGAGVGAIAGAAAGLAVVLLTRGPDLILPQGTTVEMVLDRELRYDRRELVAP